MNLAILESALGPLPEGDGLNLPPISRALWEIQSPAAEDLNELLKQRFLCRGGGLLLVGPTGIGKSAFAMQAMILWAVGREMCGVTPARALKSLLIQAENDDGDLAEMRDGIIRGLNLDEETARQAQENIIVVSEDARTGAAFFAQTVDPLLEEHKPDLVWIDPALAYLGGETNSQKDVGAFLRNQLNPLLHRHACGCVVIHHTNKPPSGREKGEWQAGDFAYLGSGSAEWSNWARAVLAVRSVGSNLVYELRAAKRGRRLNWLDADGVSPGYARLIGHAREPGMIYWREATADELPATLDKKASGASPETILANIPVNGTIAKSSLREKSGRAGVAVNRFNGLLEELLASGRAHEQHVSRKGTRPKDVIARGAKPAMELIP